MFGKEQHRNLPQRFVSSFELEGVHEMEDGMWFPLSGMMEDLHRPNFFPDSKELFQITKNILEAFGDEPLEFRGSTGSYMLLNAVGAERRGTISVAIKTGYSKSLREYAHTRSGQALGSLENLSDLDLILPNVGIDDFADKSRELAKKAKNNVADPFNVNATASRTRMKVTGADMKRRSATLTEETGTVAKHIPYDELIVKDGEKTLSKIFWTPGDLRELPDLKDTRRDPRYALSWDVASVGTVSREIPKSVSDKIKMAKEWRSMVISRGNQRMTNVGGVFSPADYSHEDRDIWFHIDKENVRVLTQPIEVGEGFGELSTIDQFRLALRATQKGTLDQENLQLGSMRSHRPAPAISETACEVFRNIDKENFKNELKDLAEEEKHELMAEAMQGMMFGFFYPSRFIEYAQATGIFDFFPQLSQMTNAEWGAIVERLTPHADYSRIQHRASHFMETVPHTRVDTYSQQMYQYKKMMDPYTEFFSALCDVVPEKTPNADNAFEAFDVLFDLENEEVLGKDDPSVVVSLLRSIDVYENDEVDELAKKIREREKRNYRYNLKVTAAGLGIAAATAAVGATADVVGSKIVSDLATYACWGIGGFPLFYRTGRRDKELREMKSSFVARSIEISYPDDPRG